MFSFLKQFMRRTAPIRNATTPPSATVHGSGFDVLDALGRVLCERGHAFTREPDHLALSSGLLLRPRFIESHVAASGSIRSTTAIDVLHDSLIPRGLHEYQHAVGDRVDSAVASGFDTWEQVDLAVLEDALRHTPSVCTVMEMTFSGRKRRILLGPTAHLARQRASSHDIDEHSYRPGCLFQNSMDAFKDLLDSDCFYGIRLFAARDQDGVATADCRINGRDFPAGAKALTDYARNWPGHGVEFRKQYIAIQTLA